MGVATETSADTHLPATQNGTLAPRAGVRRRLAFILLFVLPVLGAAIGSTLRAPPAERYRAVATLIPAPATAGEGSPEQTSRLLAGLVSAGAVRPQSLGAAGSTRAAISTRVAPGGALSVFARAETSADAQEVANSVAVQLVSLGALIYARASGRGGVLLGDFDHGLAGWDYASAFSSRPKSLAFDHLHPRYGRTDLVVGCGRAPGCGIARQIPFIVLPGVPYVASAWVRAPHGSVSIDLVFGRSPGEYVSSAPVTVLGRWRLLTLTWRPRTLSSIAELDVQRAGGTATAFAVGAVSLRDPTLPGASALTPLSPGAELALFAGDRGDTLLPARADGTVSSGTTVLWAAGGLVSGLLLGLAGLGAARAAARREQ